MKTNLKFKKTNKNLELLEIDFYSDGSKEWYKNHKLHRDYDQPALIGSDGTKQWWLNGRFIKKI